MAVTITQLPGGKKAARWQVQFSADGDTTATISHGMNGAPDHVEILYTTPQAISPGTVTRGAVTTSTITISKANAGGSAGATVEVIAYLPNGSL